MTSLAQLERGVVGYWCPMLQTTGLRLYDRSVRKNHGTLTNMDPPTDWVGANILGKSGRVLDFDGVDDRVLTSAWLGMSGAYSVSAWIKTDHSASGTRMLGSSYSGAGGVHLMGVRGTDGAVYGFAGSERWFTGLAVNDNKWHFATIIRPNTNAMQCLVDGSNLGTQSGSQTLDPGTGNNWGFGRTGFGGQWLGQFAEIAMHGRALTIFEHRTLYRLGPGWFGRREPGRRYAVAGGVTTNRRRRILCGDYS